MPGERGRCTKVVEVGVSVDTFLARLQAIMQGKGPSIERNFLHEEGRLGPASVGAAAVPAITNISPSSGPAKQDQLGSAGRGTCPADATVITITGSNFGVTQGTSYVRFWRVGSTYYNACVVTWSDSQIVAKVPGGVSSGNVHVITDGGTSNGFYFTVTYSYGGGKWPKGSYPQPMSEVYKINENTLDTTGEGAAVQAAAATWSNVAGADFRFRYGGTTTKTEKAYDEENSVMWRQADTGSIATCWTWRLADPRTLVEFDIEFNDLIYTWATDGSAEKMDVQDIATHELGHVLQLLDLYGTADAEKTMYGYGSTGETKKRSLESDDIAGISYIYPAAGTPTPTPSATPRGRIYLPIILKNYAPTAQPTP
ncbi:MAG: matrixin family metalloprotease [Chloroflexi bacterium]|nr:matrixin family metalloprotease [Chloroflexota bacterium]